ncbi:MAG: molybdopterin-dependent oxidoreductase [Acidobacteria bacterium]|nr:molybdopterin-dependent oxidoreductase [Acidobacteriota bacterium]
MATAELERRVIVAQPENSETPLRELRSWVTPNRLFFVRNHFETPEIDRAAWRLRVTGLVERELELDWETIATLPTRSVFATMECAGNGRSFLEKPVHGVQWGAGAIGHAEWVGVPLRLVLERAGVQAQAREAIFVGADRGTEPDHPEVMAFERSLPVEKALEDDTLLAIEMNGEPLTAAHGYPVRLIVPGWYGVASVKWLESIHLTDEMFHGYYQSVKYTVRRRTGSGVCSEVVGEMQPKSEILRPHEGERCGVGLNRVVGVAWAGPDPVEAVEISTDGGRSWARAELTGITAPYSWTLWQYSWRPAQPGPCQLMSRAISAAGRMQPLRHDPLYGGYLIHHSRPIPVEVAPTWSADGGDYTDSAAKAAFEEAAEERSRMQLDVEMRVGGGLGI